MGRQSFLPQIEDGRWLRIADFTGRDMMRDDCQWSSTMAWRSGLTVEFQCRLVQGCPDRRALRAQYQIEDHRGEIQQVDEVFTLQRFPQPFGGYRWYFVCPSSNRRCKVLYLPVGATHFRSRWGFRCRLQYRSQRLAPIYRYHHGARQVAKRILKSGPPDWQREHADWELPPKPPWMRSATYNRLEKRVDDYDEASNAEFALRAGRICARGRRKAEAMLRRLGATA